MIDHARRADAATVALGLLLITTSIMRFTVASTRPLWLDETQTGMLVMQSSLAAFVRQCTHDVNAPLYYILAALWAWVSGVSDKALRFLPAVLGVIAPVIALSFRIPIDRSTKFTWCALLACWIPGIWFSQEARPYTLAFALSVANSVTYVALLRAPSKRAAWTWTSVSALMILAHYFGAILVAVQGLIYLLIHKRRAIATWFAVLAFAPVLASLTIQLRTLTSFTNPASTFVQPLTPSDVFGDIGFVFGLRVLLVTTALWFCVAMVFRFTAKNRKDEAESEAGIYLWICCACSLTAIVIAFAIGFYRPFLIYRYLTEYVPGVFLGLALCARTVSRHWRLAAPALIALYATATAEWAIRPHMEENRFSWEAASAMLMANKPDRLVFLWDNPMAVPYGAPPDLGGFFFARAHRRVTVDSIGAAHGTDPNLLLIQHAAAPGSAILWIYDLGVYGTAAKTFPPRISELDSRWHCRNFGDGRFGVIGCNRSTADFLDPSFVIGTNHH